MTEFSRECSFLPVIPTIQGILQMAYHSSSPAHSCLFRAFMRYEFCPEHLQSASMQLLTQAQMQRTRSGCSLVPQMRYLGQLQRWPPRAKTYSRLCSAAIGVKYSNVLSHKQINMMKLGKGHWRAGSITYCISMHHCAPHAHEFRQDLACLLQMQPCHGCLCAYCPLAHRLIRSSRSKPEAGLSHRHSASSSGMEPNP